MTKLLAIATLALAATSTLAIAQAAATSTPAAPAPAPSATGKPLTDAQKYEARTIQAKIMAAQGAMQQAQADIEKARADYMALSKSACGGAMIDFGKSMSEEPKCAVAPTPAATTAK